MKHILFLTVLLFLILPFGYARQVDATNYGIAYASPGDYIIRSNGTKVVLQMSDINYAKNQLGLTKSSGNQSTSSKTSSYSSSSSSSGSNYGIIIVLVIVHIILTFAMYSMKGGGFACFYFFLAPVALLVLLLYLFRNAGGNISNRRL